MNNEYKQFKEFLENKLDEKGINLRKLGEISGIALNHLENLLNENLAELPPAPYIRGYLIKIGKILDFNGEEWWFYFKSKKELKTSGAGDEFPKNRFSPNSISKYIIIIAIALIILIYLIFQFNHIFGRPTVKINLPDDVWVTNEKTISVSGKAENTDKLFINSEGVILNKNGEFKKEITLENGINTIEILAQNWFGGKTKIIKQIFYKNEVGTQNPTSSNNQNPTPSSN